MPVDTPIDASPEAVRAALEPVRNDFSVALLSPGNAFAIGAIIRVAHSFLASEVFVVGEEDWYAKASMGMHKYERILRLRDSDELFAQAAGRPLWAVEKDHARRSIVSIERFPPGVIFVFGSERFGLSADIVGRANDVVGIPIYGINHSLPLTVAAGIVMHEWARRRYCEGAVL